MKVKSFVLLAILICFFGNLLNAQVVNLRWNTFLGGEGLEIGRAVAADDSGNIYVTGRGYLSWGSPVNPYNANDDVWVACLDISGNLLWNTFQGSDIGDYSEAIVLDDSGNIYIAGYCYGSWGSPLNAYSGDADIFVLKLDNSGNLLWHTFLGTASSDFAYGIALDNSGNIHITGYSDASWGTPLNAHSGSDDAFVAVLNNSGSLTWHTFIGSYKSDRGNAIEVENTGNIYITGYSGATWGSPILAYTFGSDAFVAALNSSGTLLWNTFLGSSVNEYGKDLALLETGMIAVTGYGKASWGSPINPYNGDFDGFVARLDLSGNLIWNTFFGCAVEDESHEIVLDGSGNSYVIGYSDATWGSPISAFNGNDEMVVACLDSSGNRVWNTFLGSSSWDRGYGICLNSAGDVCVTGYSNETWGSPIIPHYSGNYDAPVVSLSTNPSVDITANWSDGPISITESDTLQIRVSLNRFGSDENVDYWLAYMGPSGWVHYNYNTKLWEAGLGVTYQGPLMDLKNKKVFQSKLSAGNYTFYFGIDMNMNGKVNKGSLYKDEVQVTVTSD